MNNLFSTFDPQSWNSYSLNWISSISVLLILPPMFWLALNSSVSLLRNLLSMIAAEFKAILNSNSNPGMLLIPISLFIVITCNNALGLSSYTFTSSSHTTFTVSLALPLWIGHMVYASLKTPSSVLAHLVPLGTPPALMPFMVLIEMISSIIRPLTLSVRLAANMIAGHLLLALLAGQADSLPMLSLLALMSGLILLCVLECAVSLIQAYVFSVLSTLYLNEVNSNNISL